jgi:hypothetical protein
MARVSVGGLNPRYLGFALRVWGNAWAELR